jgi:hypothetical protein
MKDFLFAMMFIVVVATIILGIWWDAFPFWKAFGTEIFVIILYNLLKDKK